MTFGGHDWVVKASHEPVGPGPNRFAAKNAWVDASCDLHLRIEEEGSCGEVVSAQPLGYGRAEMTLVTPVAAFDPWAVLGVFTWSDDPEWSHREIDLEIARGGGAEDANLHLSVQPHQTVRLICADTPPLRLVLDWRPGRVEIGAGGISIVFEVGVPPVGGDVRLRINLWRFRGHTVPGPFEVVLRDFRFTPLAALDTI